MDDAEAPWFADPGLYFDRQGRPMRMMDWGRKHSDHDYRTVAQHWVRGWMVSTVWIGINHNFRPGPPLIFETMIFAPSDVTIDGTAPDLDRYQERYPTEAAAQAGHDRALAAMVDWLGADAVADIAGPLVAGTSDSEWDGSLPAEWDRDSGP
jgi:hypothetical protein